MVVEKSCLEAPEELKLKFKYRWELEKTGIIEQTGYREEGGGAPEKIWRVKTREIRIDLLESDKEKYGNI
jgi:hypothetical protein